MSIHTLFHWLISNTIGKCQFILYIPSYLVVLPGSVNSYFISLIDSSHLYFITCYFTIGGGGGGGGSTKYIGQWKNGNRDGEGVVVEKVEGEEEQVFCVEHLSGDLIRSVELVDVSEGKKFIFEMSTKLNKLDVSASGASDAGEVVEEGTVVDSVGTPRTPRPDYLKNFYRK